MVISFRGQLDSLADEYERICNLSITLQQENTRLKQRLTTKTVVALGEDGGAQASVTGSSSLSSPLPFTRRLETGSASSSLNGPSPFTRRLERDAADEFTTKVKSSKSDESAYSDDDVPDDIPREVTSLDRCITAFHHTKPEFDYVDVADSQGSAPFVKQASGFSASTCTTPTEGADSKTKFMDLTQPVHLPIFPKWFDPGFNDDDNYDHQALDNVWSLSEWEPDGSPWICLLRPVGRLRLTWDFCAFLCLLVELWVTPFELFFLVELETPSSLWVIQHSITAFFVVDIFLNFMTGFIEEDRTIMERRKIVKHYLNSWFWIDLVATIPFDLILMSVGGGIFSMARLGKASKAVKTLRYLKLLRAVRLVKLTAQANTLTKHFALVDHVRILVLPVQGLMFLILFAHIHGCLWQLVQNDKEEIETVGDALRRYFNGFWWAYCAVTVGSSLGPFGKDVNPWLGMVDMAVASERLLLVVFASMRVIFKSLSFVDDARKVQAHNQVLKYLRQHRVSFQTQIQVLYSLRDTGQAKKHQKYAEELFANELPQELRRQICHELWGSRLTSLGLIKEVAIWHRDFLKELSMLVFEEVFPSRSIVFRVGDAASAAYHIIKGELLVGYIVGMSLMPEFTKGMWVGESSLASSLLRRSSTIVTKSMTSVMVVPGERFTSLMSRLGLTAQYQEFCSDQLWKGLCGRCGELGDHFSDSCAKNLNYSLLSRISQESRKSFTAAESMLGSNQEMTWGSDDPFENGHMENDASDMNVEMKRYLVTNNMEFLVSILRDMPEMAGSLDKMLDLDISLLKRKVELAGFQLSKDQEIALTETAVTQFRLKNSARVSRTLFRRVSRLHHLIFLSHYKLEAGTEAALMRTELERAIEQDPGNPGHYFDEPVFLDSDNLNNLEDLQLQVKHTHNVVVLLTKDVLTRPWVLVEIVTAMREGCRILLVKVTKADCEFEFPEDHFYSDVENGHYLNEESMDVIHRCGITMHEVSDTLRHVFQKIAVPYSPHKATSIRQAEVASLLKRCQLKDT